jgi:DNA invertase Pin-like site-specific DNA recombinase
MPNALTASAASVHDHQQEDNVNKNKLTICYARLSRGDSNPGESGSIKNQREILQDYAERNNLLPVLHISDDDESGTGWLRPGWQQLMAQVEAGNVGTILLKTMDRMGRDYLRVGLFLEQFAEAGIRLIAIGDNVDTAKGEDDFVPLRNLFAEWYARDCSKKIRAVFKSRMSNGKRCSGAIPYGFLPNNGDVNDLIIDEDAAVNVRRIFQMVIEGKGVNDIARTLMGEQIPIPSEHWKRIGQPYRAIKYADPYGWTPTTVSYIIGKPEYKGTIVLGKTQNTSYKGHKAVKTSAEQQYVFENALPVIVEPEVWETAQRLKKTVRRAPKSEAAPNPLTGLLYCHECGAKLTHRHNGYDNSYICSAYRKGVRKTCSIHYISVKSIEKLLLTAIRRVACYVRDNDSTFLETVRAASVIQAESAVKESNKQLAKSKRRLDELDGVISKLFEEHALCKIPEKHFDKMFAGYSEEQSALETKVAELQGQVDEFAADSVKADRFMEIAMRYTEFPELTPQLLNEFIERVEIYEKDKSGGKVTQRIDVHFNFIGNFDVPADYDELSPEERAAANAEQERLDKKNAYEKERRRKQRESDWHKADYEKKRAMREAMAAKPEAEWTEEEIALAKSEAAQRERRRVYIKAYHQRKKAEKLAANAPAEPSAATA